MTGFALVAWDFAVASALSLGGWEHSLLRAVVRVGMSLGPLLLFRPRQSADAGVFDYEEDL